MVSVSRFRQLALSFPGTDAHPHFDKTAFRVHKKIFATLDESNKRAMIMLHLSQQSVYCQAFPDIIYPVPGKWGQGGATFIRLPGIAVSVLREMLTIAWTQTAVGAAKKNTNKKSRG